MLNFFRSAKLVKQAEAMHSNVCSQLDEISKQLTKDVPLSTLVEAKEKLSEVSRQLKQPLNGRNAIKILEQVQEGTRRVADQVKLGTRILDRIESKQKISSQGG
jgi:hypothetical protein